MTGSDLAFKFGLQFFRKTVCCATYEEDGLYTLG